MGHFINLKSETFEGPLDFGLGGKRGQAKNRVMAKIWW